MELSPSMTIEQLVEKLPQAPAILRRYGIVCIQCGEPIWGTLGEVAREKGIVDLTPILHDLGQAIKEERP